MIEQWFSEKVVVVTGAADGIGREAALMFAARGAQVVVTDINAAGADVTAQNICSQGGTAISIACDVADPTAVHSMIKDSITHFGGLHCAFNNAGINMPNDCEWDEEAFQRTLDVNLMGVMHCMRHQIPAMIASGGGAIVNTSSLTGLIASATVPQPAYTASKHAVIGLSKAAALQYARQGIRVNAICPGVTDTVMVRAAMAISEDARHTLENFAPMGRMAQPAEIAEAAIWLCSDKSSFVTGHSLVIDGGYLAQ